MLNTIGNLSFIAYKLIWLINILSKQCLKRFQKITINNFLKSYAMPWHAMAIFMVH